MFTLTADQELFEATTAQFLAAHYSAERIRALRASVSPYAGRHGPEAIQDCIQLHGGIGVTFEHDLHLFLRRAATDAQLFGTPDRFSQRVAWLIETAGGAR